MWKYRKVDSTHSLYISVARYKFISCFIHSKQIFHKTLRDKMGTEPIWSQRFSGDFLRKTVDVNEALCETFFICWIKLPADLKNWNFKKKKKKRFCLKPLQNCLFLMSSEIIEKIIISKYHSALVNHAIIKINGGNVLFCDRQSEKIQLTKMTNSITVKNQNDAH